MRQVNWNGLCVTNAMSTTTESKLFYKNIQGEEVPALGFGTWELEGEVARKAVASALGTGFRHIDTARAYGNEKEVGQGIDEANIDRKEIFVTSKIWMDALRPDALQHETEKSLELLQTGYLDLLLVHWPNPDIPIDDTFSAMESLKSQGLIRNAGISNFTPSQFREALGKGTVFCNQVEYHPFLAQDKLLEIARKNDVLLTAYSPLAKGEAIGYDDLETIGKKHGKSSEQVALRWLLEQDHVATITRSSNPEHIDSNFDVWDFELDDDDRATIAKLPKDHRKIDPAFAPDWEK